MKSCLFVSIISLLWLANGNGLDAAAAQTNSASEMFRLVNEFRASRGLPPFQNNTLLATAAQRHADWMAANVIFSHTGAGGSSPVSRAAEAGFNGYVVENIVGGSNMSPRQGLIWWQNSPTHLNTLISSNYPNAGVGFASNGEQNMYVLVVGRLSGYRAAPLASAAADRSAEPLIITPIELSEPREDGAIVHVMQQGQAMWTIAAYYDIDLDFLYLINGLTEKDILHPGDEVFVRLPDGQEPPPTPTPPLTVIVQSGESAWTIAGRHGISVEYLFLLNNLDSKSVLQPGDEVVIRLAEGQAPPPTPTPIVMHTIQSGESAWSIAAQYGLTVEELLALNALSVDSILRPGTEIRVRFPTPTPEATSTAEVLAESLPTAVPAAARAVSEEPTRSVPDVDEQQTAPIPIAASTKLTRNETASSSSPFLIIGFVLLVLATGTVFVYRRKQRVSL